MMKNPSDGNILDAIYKKYYDVFVSYDKSAPSRSSKIYVPIDCAQIASELGMDAEILFGRLYYHLDKKYRYAQDDGSLVHLFALNTGGDLHTVNFPLLAAILAEHNVSFNRKRSINPTYNQSPARAMLAFRIPSGGFPHDASGRQSEKSLPVPQAGGLQKVH